MKSFQVHRVIEGTSCFVALATLVAFDPPTQQEAIAAQTESMRIAHESLSRFVEYQEDYSGLKAWMAHVCRECLKLLEAKGVK